MQNKEAAIAEAYALRTNQCFFLTGKAGTGKTTLLKKIIHEGDKNIAVVAPTGVAAINAGGSTIHSMFGFPLKLFVPTFDRVDINMATNKALLKNHLRYKADKRKLIQELDTLIIDEISMVRADLLDAIDYALKYTRKNNRPFGGVQVIVIGDLFQLSPIARSQDWSLLRNYYASPYFFHAKIWEECKPFMIELRQVYRQEAVDFIEVLNKIRRGKVDQEVLDLLNDRYDPDFTASTTDRIILTTHNAKADDINLKALNGLKSKVHRYKADIDGSFSDSSYPIDEVLTLKEGAQVMFVRNDTEDGAYFNGKLAKIESINRDDIKVRFLDDDQTYFIKLVKWENKVYTLDKETNEVSQEVVGSFKQYPIRLAWAITIHKSQGLTFDKAVVDIGDAFAMGQTYVALSRCTNLEGMILKSRINQKAVLVNPQIQRYYENAPTTEVLQQHLKKAENQYALSLIRKAFNLAVLKEDIQDWQKLLQSKAIPDKNKAVEFILELTREHQKIASIANTFQAQLDVLFRAYKESEDPTEIKDRVTKAIDFFSKQFFEQLIYKLEEHLHEYGKKKATKAYTKAGNELAATMWGTLNKLYQVKFLGQKIWTNETYTKADVPFLVKKNGSVKDGKKSTFDITLDLYQEGLSASEIAKERSMAVSTIEGHLAKWIEQSEINIYDLIEGERVDKIVEHFEKNKGSKLTELKHSLPFETTYTELNFVLAYQKAKEKAFSPVKG